MKFLALALALLLAVGSQAASIKQKRSADPNILQILREFGDAFLKNRTEGLKQVKETHSDDDTVVHVADKLIETIATVQGLQPVVSPCTDVAFKKVEDFFKPVIENAAATLNNPKLEELYEDLGKHFEQYATETGPILKEVKTKMDAKREEMMKNVSATFVNKKDELVPILMTALPKIGENIENMLNKLNQGTFRQEIKDAFSTTEGAKEMEAAKKWLASFCSTLKGLQHH